MMQTMAALDWSGAPTPAEVRIMNNKILLAAGAIALKLAVDTARSYLCAYAKEAGRARGLEVAERRSTMRDLA